MRHALQNRIRILKEIVNRDRPPSRTSLAEQTGLSLTTLSRVTSEMVADGIICEGNGEGNGERRGVRGPRPRPLTARPYLGYSVGVDVEGLAVRAAVVDFGNCVQQSVKQELPEGAPEQVLTAAVRDVVVRALSMAHVSPERLVGIGVGLPRSLMTPQRDAGSAWPSIGALDSEALGRRLRGEWTCAVSFEHNARCFALAEQRLGRLAGCRSGAVVVARYGVAAGFVQNGVALVGEGAPAGELGHAVIREGGERCVCGRRGCLEAYAGARALLRRWKGRWRARGQRGKAGGALRDLIAAELGKDAALREIVHDGARALGLAIGNLTNIYGPMVTVVHGIYALFGSDVCALIEGSAREHMRHRLADSARVCFSDLGEFAGSIGAALLARDQGFDSYVASRVLRAQAATG